MYQQNTNVSPRWSKASITYTSKLLFQQRVSREKCAQWHMFLPLVSWTVSLSTPLLSKPNRTFLVRRLRWHQASMVKTWLATKRAWYAAEAHQKGYDTVFSVPKRAQIPKIFVTVICSAHKASCAERPVHIHFCTQFLISHWFDSLIWSFIFRIFKEQFLETLAPFMSQTISGLSANRFWSLLKRN